MKQREKAGFTIVEIAIVVVIIGILSAIALPLFQQIRAKTQKTAILNNLRQVAQAGTQYIFEVGVNEVEYTALIEGEYLKSIKKLGSEDYTTLVVSSDGGALTLQSPSAEEVIFNY